MAPPTPTTSNGSQPTQARLPEIIPAHNVEAEQAVLGAAIRDPAALAWLAGHLDPDQFYRPTHRTIARLLLELFTDNQPVTPQVMLAALRERGSLQDIGGGPYLLALDEATTTAANVGFFGRRVLAAAHQRETADQLIQLAQALAEGADPQAVAALGIERFQQLLDGSGDDGIGGPLELLQSLREVRDRRLAGRRLSWKLENLDDLTGGLEPGQMVIVAARPGAGKSSLGLQLAAFLAEQVRTCFISYEMGRSQMARRQLAMYAHVPTDAAIMRVDDPALAAARVAYESLDFTFIDSGHDLERMIGQVMALHATRPFGLIVVDYAQLIPVDPRRYKNREQEVAAISRGLRRLARRLNVALVVLAQLNRDADGREPVLKDLRESGQLEQDADLVVFLHDDDKQKSTKAIVAKHRDGQTGSTWLRFDRPRTVFSDDYRALSS
jgi:replicative DNA helicase